jgi:hypothetical protein
MQHIAASRSYEYLLRNSREIALDSIAGRAAQQELIGTCAALKSAKGQEIGAVLAR